MSRRNVHLPFLDGIRGIAILIVFLFHVLTIVFSRGTFPWDGALADLDFDWRFLLLSPVTYGTGGVAVFFVVSGFCIHLSYRRAQDDGWLPFYNRRTFRILPPYLAAVLFFYFQPWGKIPEWNAENAWQLLSHLFAIHNVDIQTLYGINASFWSIAVEIQLYLIYPLLILLLRRVRWRYTLILLAVLEFSIHGAEVIRGEALPVWISKSPFAYWLSWTLGAWLAEYYLGESKPPLLSWLRFDVVLICAVFSPLWRYSTPLSFFLFALLTAIAIERLVEGRWKTPADAWPGFIWKHLSFLGGVSYGFYLFHQPLLAMAHGVIKKWLPSIATEPLALFAICCLSYFPILIFSRGVFLYLEKPSIAAGKWFWKSVVQKGREK